MFWDVHEYILDSGVSTFHKELIYNTLFIRKVLTVLELSHFQTVHTCSNVPKRNNVQQCVLTGTGFI